MTTNKVAMLVDGDNVSADVVEQAVAALLADHGAIHLRRAYCTAESALKNLALYKRLAIRPMVNIAAGKNSTDIALAVDAIDLVLAERPDVVAIVSSDSDFAPLVVRLREKGCRVVGIGQDGKTGDETIAVYDGYTVLRHRKGGGATKVAEPKPAKAPKAPKAPRAAKKARPAVAAAPALPEDVERILQAVPTLRDGTKVDLRIAAEPLRAAGLLSNSAPSPKLFRKHAGFFALTPDKNPNKVQFLGSAR
jgi:uncharacterized protein (TIGR00288 family)